MSDSVFDLVAAELNIIDPPSPSWGQGAEIRSGRPTTVDDAPPMAGGETTGLIDPRRFVTGGSFIFDQPDGVPAVWGRDDQVLWSRGEELLIVGPPGVGKTTLTGQVIRGRLGLGGDVLGWPVTPGERKVLYLAMDRPSQIARALRRHFTDDERDLLDERLVIWPGPPPADVADHPELLADLCESADADTLVVDSLKDAAIALSDDKVGAAINRAVQGAIVKGIEVLSLHHQRKGQGGEKPKTLADVYGSTWITAGAGSVLLLWGQAGDPVVELHHLKQPAADVGPLNLTHDHHAGTTTVSTGWDPLAWLNGRGRGGGTAKDAAQQMFEKTTPSENERKKAERRLDALVRRGAARKTEASKGGTAGTTPARFYSVTTFEDITGGPL